MPILRLPHPCGWGGRRGGGVPRSADTADPGSQVRAGAGTPVVPLGDPPCYQGNRGRYGPCRPPFPADDSSSCRSPWGGSPGGVLAPSCCPSERVSSPPHECGPKASAATRTGGEVARTRVPRGDPPRPDSGCGRIKAPRFLFLPDQTVSFGCVCTVTSHLWNFPNSRERWVREARLWGTVSEEGASCLLRQENSLIFSCQTTGWFNHLSLLKPQTFKFLPSLT